MNTITKNEAQIALNESNSDPLVKMSILSGPDLLGAVSVFFVRSWDGDNVDFMDMMFVKENGKVQVRK